MNSSETEAARSFKHIGDHLYTFTFRGDYGFQDFLEQGGAKTDIEMAMFFAKRLSNSLINVPWGKEVRFDAGCSTIQGDGLYCRSFDFGDKKQNMVIIKTFPVDAYASISTSSFAFLGFGDEWIPNQRIDRLTALQTIYMPFDGINEKGVCVADLIELDGDTTNFDTKKPDLTIVGAIRLVLDYAGSTNEAIELLKQYDIHKSIGWAHHLSIADTTRAVVVEWKQGEMHVTDADIVTNHCRWEERQTKITKESKARLARLTPLPRPNNMESAINMIQAAAYSQWTIWSIIFNQKTCSGTWYIRRDWDNPIVLTIKENNNNELSNE